MRSVLMPGSLDELWRAMEKAPQATVYAGGTDLLVRMRSGLVNPDALICLERIPELREVRDECDDIRIGTGTTHAALLSHPAVGEHLPVLTQAVRVLGSPLIRNVGTLGGNICTASPAGDTLPPLYVLKASVELLSHDGARTLALEDFITGPGKTCLEPGEILSAIRVRKPTPKSFQHFEKVGLRNALACSVVSLAALVSLSSDGTVEQAELAWGSIGPTVVRCPEAQTALQGRKLDIETLQEAAAVVQRTVSPISDVRAGADYRRTVSGNLLLRLALLGNPQDAAGSAHSRSERQHRIEESLNE
ncbi:MAG: xanthine dehydrogenase family protein subunit M [Syntrophobacteraceae bacterium]